MGPKFFETIMGKRFYEGTMPSLLKGMEGIAGSLNKIAEELVKLNKNVAELAKELKHHNDYR